MADPLSIYALYQAGAGKFKSGLETGRKFQEIESRGVNVPWWQKYNPIAGPWIARAKEARTRPDIPTRQSAGLGGDAAMQLSARAYQDMLRRQMGMEVSNINREFGAAGRFTSGQRLSAIQEAQQGGRQAFSDAFARMALQRYLGEQDIGSRERIAQAQLEAAGGQGRTQLTGSILQSLALIFASNPELFGKVGGGIKSGASAIGGFFGGGGEDELRRRELYGPGF